MNFILGKEVAFFEPLVFIFGLLVGSFANVFIIRFPGSRSFKKLWWPPSNCPKCSYPLRWYENIPILSYLALRGKCSQCRGKISMRYPVVEFLMGLLFLVAYQRAFDFLDFLIHGIPLMFLILTVSFIDIDLRIIPDELSLGGMIFGFLVSIRFGFDGILTSLLGMGFGFGFFFLIATLYERLTGKTGIGGGDIKFLGTIGAFLGWKSVFFTIFTSSILGSVVGILLGFFSKNGKGEGVLKSSIPYGPFLALGALIDYAFGHRLWSLFMTQI